MTRPITLSVVMPAFNEEPNIQAVIDEHVDVLRSLKGEIADWEIVCVDDASTDGTAAVLRKAMDSISGLRTIRHAQNRGIFESFNDAIRAANGTHIYATASDGQWPARNLVGMFKTLKDSKLALVVAVRTNRSAVYGPWRRVISFCFNLLPRLLFRVKTSDAGSVKLGVREVFLLDLISRSPFGEAERIVRAQREGFKVGYYPIQFSPRVQGKMTGARFHNVYRSLFDCIRCVFAYGLRSK